MIFAANSCAFSNKQFQIPKNEPKKRINKYKIEDIHFKLISAKIESNRWILLLNWNASLGVRRSENQISLLQLLSVARRDFQNQNIQLRHISVGANKRIAKKLVASNWMLYGPLLVCSIIKHILNFIQMKFTQKCLPL